MAAEEELLALRAIFPEIQLISGGRMVIDAGRKEIPVAVTIHHLEGERPRFEVSSPLMSVPDKSALLQGLQSMAIDLQKQQEEAEGSSHYLLVEGVLACVREHLDDQCPPSQESTPKTPPPTEQAVLELNIFSGPILEDRKSVFQAHVAGVSSKEEAMAVLARLKQNAKIARATHNIYAWRVIKGRERSLELHDCEDDGEHQAGAKLLHLLVMMGVSNVMVVVTRWYGGIHLGTTRFRHICNVARQVLIENGFVVEGSGNGSTSK